MVKADNDRVVVDVMATLKGGFPLTVYVVDERRDVGEGNAVKLQSTLPREDIYEVSQVADESTGGFSVAKEYG